MIRTDQRYMRACGCAAANDAFGLFSVAAAARLWGVSRSSRQRFEQQVTRTVQAYDLLEPGQRVLVAVSGGPDSVALLYALAAVAPRWSLTLAVAHYNHRLRGEESTADEAFVTQLAASLGLPLHVDRAPEVLSGAALEARTRRQRYAFLTDVATGDGWQRIATGHTLDDQAETVLMRLLRGSGGAGLSAIRPRRGPIVRPLLDVPRRAVLEYLSERGVGFRTDVSNTDARFLRNRVRHQLLPELEALQPQVRRALASTADLVRRDGLWLDRLARRRLAKAMLESDALSLVDLSAQPEPVLRRMLVAWFERRGLTDVSARHVDAVAHLVGGVQVPRGVTLPGGWVARRRSGLLLLEPAVSTVAAAAVLSILLPPEGDLELVGGWSLRCATAAAVPADCGPQAPFDCRIDVAALPGPLHVRVPRVGDRMRPLGLGGSKKLQDLFVDRRVPRAERATWPVLESGGEILWVAGVARSPVALVAPASESVLRLCARRSGVAGAESLC